MLRANKPLEKGYTKAMEIKSFILPLSRRFCQLDESFGKNSWLAWIRKDKKMGVWNIVNMRH